MKLQHTTIAILASCAVLIGCGGSGSDGPVNTNTRIAMWTTTSVKMGDTYVQQDRLANPVINEVFATFANDRHKINNLAAPPTDRTELTTDVQSFMVGVAGRSQAITDVVKAVVIPDMMLADLGVAGTGSYLGTQTGGATGSRGGGRELGDDVVDISLSIVFGNTISALGLAPDDGNAIPTLTSDNVGAGGKHFTNQFPYLGTPR